MVSIFGQSVVFLEVAYSSDKARGRLATGPRPTANDGLRRIRKLGIIDFNKSMLGLPMRTFYDHGKLLSESKSVIVD